MLSCIILSVILSGISSVNADLPQRFINRDLRAEEFVGAWHITPNSELQVNKYVEEQPPSSYGADTPFASFTLNSNGTCQIVLKIEWLPGYQTQTIAHETPSSYKPAFLIHYDELVNTYLSCTWKISKESDYNNDKEVPIIDLEYEYSGDQYTLTKFYIFEENGKLILWNFIGDPDQFSLQDFSKIK